MRAAITSLRWIAVAAGAVLSVDALLTTYKAVVFRDGIEGSVDLSVVLLICVALTIITSMTGIGAAIGLIKQGSVLERRILLIAIGAGAMFLAANALPFAGWMQMALTAKSESVGICFVLCCLLAWMTWRADKHSSLQNKPPATPLSR